MTTPNDDTERLRALVELRSTLLVEAAAGTGKTSLLAGRAVMLLAAGTKPHSIAAITFTELAAGELRQRVAQYLEALLAGSVPDELRLCLPKGPTPTQQAALREAVSRLDELTCSTIHGFCHDLLRTYSVEAGVDPGAEVLDRDQADFVFDAIFDQWWKNRLNNSRPDHDPVALIARKDPTGAEDFLRKFAKFRRQYRNARPAPPDLDPSADLDFVESVHEFRRWFNRVRAPADADAEVSGLERLASHFDNRFEPLPNFEKLWDLAHPTWLPIMRRDSFDLHDYRRRSLWKRLGGKEHGDRLADQAEEHYGRCREAYGILMGRTATAIASVFSAELDDLLSEYEAFKRRAAVLDFDDLLFTCRDILRAHGAVRRAAADRYSRVLVDEFQDTDPIQAEIIFLLSTEEGPEIWHNRRLVPGHLFLVGDPKQAIYRFRGADLATYLLVRQAIAAQFPQNILNVTANFRSRAQILRHVNLCFEERLSAQDAGYVSLHSTRGPADHGFPCVAKVTIDLPPNTWLDSTRDEEARKVAEICARLIGNVELKLNEGTRRRLAPGDIALLAPVSTDLWRYERALEEAGLPFASQAGKNLFRRQEAQDLVALVRTLADPRDTFALGALLRGPLVGLTEQELLSITERLPAPAAGAEFAPLSLRIDPASLEHEVAREVLITLRDLRLRIRSTTPALLLAEAVERLRIRAIVAARSSDQAARALANIDGLLERARRYGVRGFTQFSRDLNDDWSSGSGFTEGLVEADGQSIEIVTIHSSKGLEWPVVIPINRASMPRRAEAFIYRRSDESLHWALGQVTPPSLEGALQGENAEKRNENLRLLYVACTRAMELLVIPDFTWSNDASWAKQLDLKLGEVPELDVMHLPRGNFAVLTATENGQSSHVFAAEQSRLENAYQCVHWIHPSNGDSDVVPIQLPPSLTEDEPLQSSPTIEGSRIRGVILHKVMEELLNGEIRATLDAVSYRARALLDQLAPLAHSTPLPDTQEMASTALRTLALPELEPFHTRLVPEVPIYGMISENAVDLVAGRADAVGWAEDTGKVVIDWKSDVAPKEEERTAYRHQLGQYLHAIGAQRGAIVYMTSGRVDWVTVAPR